MFSTITLCASFLSKLRKTWVHQEQDKEQEDEHEEDQGQVQDQDEEQKQSSECIDEFSSFIKREMNNIIQFMKV